MGLTYHQTAKYLKIEIPLGHRAGRSAVQATSAWDVWVVLCRLSVPLSRTGPGKASEGRMEKYREIIANAGDLLSFVMVTPELTKVLGFAKAALLLALLFANTLTLAIIFVVATPFDSNNTVPFIFAAVGGYAWVAWNVWKDRKKIADSWLPRFFLWVGVAIFVATKIFGVWLGINKLSGR
jgi:hypothetical protein